VLAVGDINFQKKCLGKMGDVARQGRTVVLVSHQMNQIRRLCHRVVWVDGGRIRMTGSAHEVVSAYESAMARGDRNGNQQERSPGSRGRFIRWEIVMPRGDNPHVLTDLVPTTIAFTVEIRQPIRKGHHGIALYDNDRQLIWASSTDGVRLSPGEHSLCHSFPMLPVRPGPYSWLVSLYDDEHEVDAWECVPEMVVATEGHQHRDDRWNGILNMPSRFAINGRAKCDEDVVV
jgi:hypothetical protein